MLFLLSFALFVAGINGDLNRIESLKKNWKHPHYKSFDHFWHEEYANGSLDHADKTWMMLRIEEARIECILEGKCPTNRPSITGQQINCVDGVVDPPMAGYEGITFPCSGIDLASFISLRDLGSGVNADGNDIWGYQSGENYYALTGQTDGSSIVDVTDPVNPVVLVFVPSTTYPNNILWRDIKVPGNGYVYIVADGSGHGLQYYNVDDLIVKGRASVGAGSGYYTAQSNVDYFTATWISNSHNIIENRDKETVYSCGSRNNQNSNGGIIRYTLSAGGIPTVSGAYSGAGYTHDAECVVYRNVDSAYVGQEICFGYQGGNPNELLILLITTDTNDQATFTEISKTPYSFASYTHQGWLSDDHKYLFLNDEADESREGFNTRTLLVDLNNLASPPTFTEYFGPTKAIDHNLYVVGNLVYESNYQAGLRVNSYAVEDGALTMDEEYYFKVWQPEPVASFNGAWSSYPMWVTDTGVVVTQDIETGLYVYRMSDFTTNPSKFARLNGTKY